MNTALRRVSNGYVDCATHDEAESLWIRLAVEGRVVSRHTDNERDRNLRVHLTIIEHPAVAPNVYAIFGMGQGTLNTYACTADDALAALHDPAAFNL